jgi:hypothetical protein
VQIVKGGGVQKATLGPKAQAHTLGPSEKKQTTKNDFVRTRNETLTSYNRQIIT